MLTFVVTFAHSVMLSQSTALTPGFNRGARSLGQAGEPSSEL